MSDGENVVSFRPPTSPVSESVSQLDGEHINLLHVNETIIANLTAFCERLEEGMQHVAKALVEMDARIRRLELAQNKADREKAKPSVLNHHGQKAN